MVASVGGSGMGRDGKQLVPGFGAKARLCPTAS